MALSSAPGENLDPTRDAAPPPKDRLSRFDPKAIAEKLRAHPSPVVRRLGTFVFVAILIATLYSLFSNWRVIGAFVLAIPEQIQSLAVLSPLQRTLVLALSTIALIALAYYAGGSRPRVRKLIALSLTSLPLLGMALSMATTRGYAEVPSRNIGIVASQPFSGEIFAAARSQARIDGDNGIGIYEYDLSRQGFDRVGLRQFIDTHNIRYLIISSAMAPTDIASLDDLIGSRGLTIITTPEANADGLTGNAVGIWVSPESEADQIEGQLVDDGVSRVLLIYDRPTGEFATFENRFRTKLGRGRALNVANWTTDDLRSSDPYLLAHLGGSDTIVLADGGPHSIDMLRRIRTLNPGARLISTSRVLDYSNLQTLRSLQVETTLPWPVVDAYNRASANGGAPAPRLPSPIETASASATRLAILLERHLGHLRSPAIRDAMMANQTPWIDDLERYYGEVSFAEGSFPHLRIGLLRTAGFTAPDRRARTRP